VGSQVAEGWRKERLLGGIWQQFATTTGGVGGGGDSMTWYRVHFNATKTGYFYSVPSILRVRFDCELEAESPVDAIDKAVYLKYGYGNVESRVLDGDVWIPIEWEFDEEPEDGVLDFKLWIDERDAVLSNMVTELSPDIVLRKRGVPGLFEEVTA
jgi:hypothetical protein